MKGIMVYYYVIEANLNNKKLKENFSEFNNLYNTSDIAVFSSNECSNYKTCLLEIADKLDSKINIMNKDKNHKFKMFWEKNLFDEEEDKNNDYWLDNEVIKINISDIKNNNSDWVFKSRIFFKSSNHIFDDHLTIQ